MLKMIKFVMCILLQENPNQTRNTLLAMGNHVEVPVRLLQMKEGPLRLKPCLHTRMVNIPRGPAFLCLKRSSVAGDRVEGTKGER